MTHRMRRMLIVSLVVFSVTLVTLLILRNTVREIVVIPVLYLFWLGGLIFRSIHQLVFWGVLVLLVALFLFRSLPRRSESKSDNDQTRRDVAKGRRVAHWAGEIRRNADGPFRNAYSLQGFRKLITSVWAYRTNLSPQEIEGHIRDGRLELPPELQLYFQNNDWSPPPRTSIFRRMLRRVKTALKADDSTSPSAFDQQLYSMIQSLETQLEVTHDHRDPASLP